MCASSKIRTRQNNLYTRRLETGSLYVDETEFEKGTPVDSFTHLYIFIFGLPTCTIGILMLKLGKEENLNKQRLKQINVIVQHESILLYVLI